MLTYKNVNIYWSTLWKVGVHKFLLHVWLDLKDILLSLLVEKDGWRGMVRVRYLVVPMVVEQQENGISHFGHSGLMKIWLSSSWFWYACQMQDRRWQPKIDLHQLIKRYSLPWHCNPNFIWTMPLSQAKKHRTVKVSVVCHVPLSLLMQSNPTI